MSEEGYAYISLVLPGPTAIHRDRGEEDCIVLIRRGGGGKAQGKIEGNENIYVQRECEWILNGS